MRIIIVGGGIIGAALARKLADAGADVLVFDSRAAGATGASFGWVNASFYLDDHHFALRMVGIDAWRGLDVPLNPCGCLCWEGEGDDLDRQRDALTLRGYGVEEVDKARFAALEPHVAAPDRALRFKAEAVADPMSTTARLLNGVRVVRGVPVTGIATHGHRVTGAETAQGAVAADRVIVAAGCASPDLLASVGVDLPLLDRPGVMMRTAAVAPCLSHVLATPATELRQDAGGHLWAPTSAQHQGDDATAPDTRPDLLADRAVARVQALLPDVPIRWDQVTLAWRPVPQDQRPVFGPCGPAGLFTAVMHSGITLAAITAELLGAQVLDQPLSNAQTHLAAPYDPARFQSGMS
ncbi:MAG: FAD-dependent oxidoreductase [Pseudomonadota bacterium]